MTYQKLKIPIILISLPYIFFDVLLPLYTNELGYSTFQFTLLVSVFSLSQLIMRLLLGKMSDRYSRRSIFIASLLCFIFAYAAFAAADSLAVLVTARVINGAASILLTLSIFGIITDAGGSYAQSLGRYDSNRNLGGFIGVGLCYFILSRFELLSGWSVLFAACGAAAALALGYTVFTPAPVEAKRPVSAPRSALPPEKRKVWFVNILFCLLSSMITVILIPYLQDVFAADMQEITIAFLLPIIVSAFTGPVLGKVGDRIGYRKAIAVSALIAAGAAAAAVFSSGIIVFALLWTVLIMADAMLGFALDAMFLQGIPERQVGDAYGKYSTGAYLGLILGPALGGFLFDTYGSAVPYFAFAGGMVLFIGMVWSILPRDMAAGQGQKQKQKQKQMLDETVLDEGMR